MLDGYSLSTKDATHKKRSRKASATIEIKKRNLWDVPCGTSRNTFLSNYKNTKTFGRKLLVQTKGLAAKMRILHFRVFECPCEADTTIVKVALKY